MKDQIELLRSFRTKLPEPVPHLIADLSSDYFFWKLSHPSWTKGHIHLETRNHDIIGSVTFCAKRIICSSAIIEAAEVGDSFTDPHYQRRGVFTKGARACVQEALNRGFSLIYGTPNDAALPGWTRNVNFVVVKGTRVALVTRLTSQRAYVRRTTRYLKVRWLSLLAAGIHKALRDFVAALRRPRSGFVQLEQVSHVEAAAVEDGTWGSDRSRYAFFSLRDHQYINWRFFASPEPFRFYLVRREQRVVGYVVTKMTENGGERVGSICDFVCKGDDENTAYTIFYLALQELTNAGADYVELYCAEGNNYWKCVRRLGFRPISLIPIMVYVGTPIGRAIANGSGSWHFTLADCDAV